ncbi:MAG: D-alanine--D-alanine ligase family protein [Oscillospiraceae bacterium]
MKQSIGIIFGGASSEYEVSLMSSTSVLNNIDTDRYDIYKIGISKQGQMFYYTGDVAKIISDEWNSSDCIPCVISPDRTHHGFILLNGGNEIIRLDAVFPVLHGKNGEDGTIQGLFTMAGIPYVGCDTLSSAACMDKGVTHTILDSAGISTAKWLGILQHSYKINSDAFLKEVADTLGFPCFVKPANAGSSVGITKAVDKNTLRDAMEVAFLHDKKVIVEEMLYGIEIECAVLGNEDPIASVLGEIEPCNDFYDYDAKYLANKTKTYIPARIDEKHTHEIRTTAVKAFKAIGCEGFSRVDFFLTKDNRVMLNEINTIPGFTSISMYPQLFINSGVSYKDLITKLIDLAIERN